MTHSIIVGGSKGLGKILARHLIARGDKVSVISRKRPIHNEIEKNVNYHQADISNSSQTATALGDAIKHNGPLSYLIFCQRYRGQSDQWRGEIEISLTAPKEIIDLSLTLFDKKKSDKGIVFVSSVLGSYVGEDQDISYHVCKAGINQMMRFYAANLGRKGIRSNCVSPFTYLKEESKNFYLENNQLMSLYAEIVPIRRMATAEDTVNMILFLCSKMASFVTGQNIFVDGGLSVVWPETQARKLMGIQA
jgi:NAD(P)-dependent dehydrogenase (short-subunit alcohol dehydrogenase family)